MSKMTKAPPLKKIPEISKLYELHHGGFGKADHTSELSIKQQKLIKVNNKAQARKLRKKNVESSLVGCHHDHFQDLIID